MTWLEVPGGDGLGSPKCGIQILGNRSQKTLGLTRGVGHPLASAGVFVGEITSTATSGQCRGHAIVECDRVSHAAANRVRHGCPGARPGTDQEVSLMVLPFSDERPSAAV